MNLEQCAECEKSLTALDIKYGWVTVRGVRVHTLCKERWMNRTSYERDVKIGKVK
jgi:hypothetical protein